VFNKQLITVAVAVACTKTFKTAQNALQTIRKNLAAICTEIVSFATIIASASIVR